MLRIGPEPTNGSISSINIRDNEKVVGILKEPTGAYSLDVSGTINCDALLINRSAFSSGSSVWDLSDSNTISYTNGNVGIGTDSPDSALQVAGNIEDPPTTSGVHLGYSLNNSKIFLVPNTSTANSEIEFYSLDSGDYGKIEYDHTNNRLQFQTNSADRMTIDSDGNVGIGTTDPAYPLDVSGDVLINGSLRIGGTRGVSVFMGSTDYSAYFGNYIYAPAIINSTESGTTPTGIVFGETSAIGTDEISLITYGITRAYINGSGNVGIGTTSPDCRLHVYGNSSPSLIVEYPGNSVTLQSWRYLNDSGGSRSMWLLSPGDYTSSSFSGFAGTFIFRTNDAFSFYTDDNHVCHMASGGAFTVFNFNNSSDDRLKSNEIPITDALTTIMKLNPMTYDKYNNMNKSGNYFRESGLISQDIWYQVPELRHIVTLGSEYKDGTSTVPTPIDVSNNELLEDADYNNLGWSTTEPSSVKYLGLIAYLIKAVQELNIQRQQEKDALQASHDSLQASHDSLKDEMAELKALLQEKSVI